MTKDKKDKKKLNKTRKLASLFVGENLSPEMLAQVTGGWGAYRGRVSELA